MIKVFSQDQMIDYYTSFGVVHGEYYISIISTGGPKGVPVFPSGHNNVITLVFDDVVEDTIKDKWPDGIGKFMAKAMTVEQARLLAKFIKNIPNNSSIIVHCGEGKSRSVAIAAALRGDSMSGNEWVYSLVRDSLK
jgi:predicted protein tyrosine phosphatase